MNEDKKDAQQALKELKGLYVALYKDLYKDAEKLMQDLAKRIDTIDNYLNG